MFTRLGLFIAAHRRPYPRSRLRQVLGLACPEKSPWCVMIATVLLLSSMLSSLFALMECASSRSFDPLLVPAIVMVIGAVWTGCLWFARRIDSDEVEQMRAWMQEDHRLTEASSCWMDPGAGPLRKRDYLRMKIAHALVSTLPQGSPPPSPPADVRPFLAARTHIAPRPALSGFAWPADMTSCERSLAARHVDLACTRRLSPWLNHPLARPVGMTLALLLALASLAVAMAYSKEVAAALVMLEFYVKFSSLGLALIAISLTAAASQVLGPGTLATAEQWQHEQACIAPDSLAEWVAVQLARARPLRVADLDLIHDIDQMTLAAYHRRLKQEEDDERIALATQDLPAARLAAAHRQASALEHATPPATSTPPPRRL